jgi:hypothetical protein
VLPGATAAGFGGVYVDKAAYADGGQAIEAALRRETGTDPLTSADGRFLLFDLHAYRADLERRLSATGIRALADGTLHPVRTDWPNVFTDGQQEGTELFRWCTTPIASIALTNSSDAPRRATLSVKLARPGGEAAPVTLTYPDGTTQTVQATPDGVDVERTIAFPAGDSAIGLRIDGPGIPSGFVKLTGWRITAPTDE